MNFNKKLAVAVSGAVLLMAGQIALADSTTDIVDALVSKGVLTEEEGKLISKGAKSQKEAQDKTIKGKLSISSALENATIYGDIRARYERRDGDTVDTGINTDSNRARYKITLGVETKAGDWYSDLAVAMSKNGRSDNVSFGDTGTSLGGDSGMSPKDASALYVKRAMIGWNATPWLAIEAGRMKNPLYMVNAMVFDHDIVMEGAQEKLKYTMGDTNLFANFGQWVYSGKELSSTDGDPTKNARQNMVLAFQAGAEQAFIPNTMSAKAAVGYYNYTAQSFFGSAYVPTSFSKQAAANDAAYVPGSKYGVNDLGILDIPAEINYMVTSNIGVRPYAEYAYNTNGSDRRNSAINASTGSAKTKLQAGSNDDTAWLVGISVGSAKDLKSFAGKKMAKGDWSANLWYQETGTYALDNNAVDTDIFDGRINMKGTTLKAQYNLEDNVLLNFTGGWGSRKNSQYSTGGPKTDIGGSIDDYTLYQFDATYKF